jgi:hypothetical protein
MTNTLRASSLAGSGARTAPERRRPPRFRPRTFGRRARFIAAPQPARRTAISDDLRLFTATFAAGFLFVSVLIV